MLPKLGGGTTNFLRADGTWAEPPGGGGGGTTVNVEPLSNNKTIATGDPTYQLLDPSGANRDVYLPASPTGDERFVVVNTAAASSAYYLEVQLSGDTNYFTRLYAQAAAEFVYDSTDAKWQMVGPGARRVRTGSNTYSGGENVAVGYAANGSPSGAAVGYSANGSTFGAAVGYASNGAPYGAAFGYNSNGSSYGAAVGNNANGSSNGAAVGYSANGATYGAAVGFDANTNSKGYAIALGYRSKCQRYSELAISSDHQSTCKNAFGQVAWLGSTTNDTATELYLHGVASNRCTILASSVVQFHIRLVAREDATGDCKIVEVLGGIKRDASNNTALIGSVTSTTICEDAGASGWSVAVTADDTNESLKIAVTGEASHTIKWHAVAVLIDTRN